MRDSTSWFVRRMRRQSNPWYRDEYYAGQDVLYALMKEDDRTRATRIVMSSDEKDVDLGTDIYLYQESDAQPSSKYVGHYTIVGVFRIVDGSVAYFYGDETVVPDRKYATGKLYY